MCDILSKPCEICGTMIPMHLVDYKTKRYEIMVFCNKCMLSTTFSLFYDDDRSVVWNTHTKDRKVLVMSLTDNAWSNREGNHPNVGNPEVYDIEEIRNKRKSEMDKSLKRFESIFKEVKKK